MLKLKPTGKTIAAFDTVFNELIDASGKSYALVKFGNETLGYVHRALNLDTGTSEEFEWVAIFDHERPVETLTDDGCKAVPLKGIAYNEFFKRKPTSKTVYQRGTYDRETKRYSCIDTDDANREIFLKGDTIVYVGFTF